MKTKRALSNDKALLLLKADYGRELAMVLKVLPILGPSKRITAITTMATRARIIAYSTRPWPFSFGANNIVNLPFNKKILGLPEGALSANYMTVSETKSYAFRRDLFWMDANRLEIIP